MESAPQKRQRTELQLARKRQADRVSQKAKREQAKRNMDHLETQLAKLQDTVELLSDQLQAMHAELRERDKHCPSHCRPPPPQSTASDVQPLGSLDGDNNAETSKDENPSEVPAKQPSSKKRNRSPADSPLDLIKCLCGVQHQVQSECLEYSTFSILLKTHENLAEGKELPITTWLPRTPSLVSIFCPAASTNPVIRILGAFFRQVHPTKVSTLLACCLLMYRYLRWRLYPDKETFRDVPEWVHPTEIQKTVPHPVCVDFIPWPKLRDYIVLHKYTDPRHSVSLFIRSIRVRWPDNRDFYTMSAQGELLLDPEFEEAVYRYENWQISKDWIEMFPALKDYVNVEEDEGDSQTAPNWP
ncbi:uncharacterized protein TRUGW13939_04928 [Talaromyces rugulosus]|uniref:BZIP domain-containing protein n=1 Tax=Talaromyces rugulosus TaxID=121627 RepID=A0A7H8QVV6_TALRU|nr:uncharacterized protein TRUGW13939_04928 [Talaromyces rugulosus]QKX57808.1 hypothetical protein TRUGW13939_04928 [Talaromyces rugulosus]